MALVKQEKGEDMESDAWLKQWADIKQEIKEEDDMKPDLSKFNKNDGDSKQEASGNSNRASISKAKNVENVLSFQEKIECAPVSNEVADLCEYEFPHAKKYSNQEI